MEGVSVEFCSGWFFFCGRGLTRIAVRLVAGQEDRREQVILTGVELAISH